jgi:hypothetical protein
MNPILITEYSIRVRPLDNPYAAPETYPGYLAGKVYGHPKFPDGSFVCTSDIELKIDEETIKTVSGNIYKLGKKDADFQMYLDMNYT